MFWYDSQGRLWICHLTVLHYGSLPTYSLPFKHWVALLMQPKPCFSLLVSVCILTVLFNTVGHKPPGKNHQASRPCTGPRGGRHEPTTVAGSSFLQEGLQGKRQPWERAPIPRCEMMRGPTGHAHAREAWRTVERGILRLIICPKEPHFKRGSGCVTLTAHFQLLWEEELTN